MVLDQEHLILVGDVLVVHRVPDHLENGLFVLLAVEPRTGRPRDEAREGFAAALAVVNLVGEAPADRGPIAVARAELGLGIVEDAVAVLLRETRQLVELLLDPPLAALDEGERADDQVPETAVDEVGHVLQRQQDPRAHFLVHAARIHTGGAVGRGVGPVLSFEGEVLDIDEILLVDRLRHQPLEPLRQLAVHSRIHIASRR